MEPWEYRKLGNGGYDEGLGRERFRKKVSPPAGGYDRNELNYDPKNLRAITGFEGNEMERTEVTRDGRGRYVEEQQQWEQTQFDGAKAQHFRVERGMQSMSGMEGSRFRMTASRATIVARNENPTWEPKYPMPRHSCSFEGTHPLARHSGSFERVQLLPRQGFSLDKDRGKPEGPVRRAANPGWGQSGERIVQALDWNRVDQAQKDNTRLGHRKWSDPIEDDYGQGVRQKEEAGYRPDTEDMMMALLMEEKIRILNSRQRKLNDEIGQLKYRLGQAEKEKDMWKEKYQGLAYGQYESEDFGATAIHESFREPRRTVTELGTGGRMSRDRDGSIGNQGMAQTREEWEPQRRPGWLPRESEGPVPRGRGEFANATELLEYELTSHVMEMLEKMTLTLDKIEKRGRASCRGVMTNSGKTFEKDGSLERRRRAGNGPNEVVLEEQEERKEVRFGKAYKAEATEPEGKLGILPDVFLRGVGGGVETRTQTWEGDAVYFAQHASPRQIFVSWRQENQKRLLLLVDTRERQTSNKRIVYDRGKGTKCDCLFEGKTGDVWKTSDEMASHGFHDL